MLAAPLAANPALGGGFRQSRERSPVYMAQHGGQDYATQSFEPAPAARPEIREPGGNGAGPSEGVGLEQLLPKHTHVLIR